MNVWEKLLNCSLAGTSEAELLMFVRDRARGMIKSDGFRYFSPEDVDENAGASSISLKQLYSDLVGTDFSLLLLDRALESPKIDIETKVGKIVAGHSFYFSNSNIIVFKSKFGLLFFVQIRRSLDAIIAPNIGIAVGRKLESVEKVCAGFMRALFNGLERYVEYLSGDNSFGGLLLSNDLPYHYYYDDMPGFINLLMKRRDKFDRFEIFAHENEAFYPVDALFNGKKKVVKLDAPKRGELSYVNGSFFLSAVRNEKQFATKLIENCDLNLKESIAKNASWLISADVKTIDWSLPTLWLGILCGKRQWLEQAEAYIYILNHELYDEDINIVFDGMTVDSFSEQNPSEIHSDVINYIMSKVDLTTRKVLSLNGRNVADKFYVASKVDFFVSDAATSSIYVSRFYKRPGICHSLGRSRISGHIHSSYVYHLNDGNVVDLQPDESWIYAQYSIDPSYFKNIFLKKAANYLPLKVVV